MRVFFLQSMLFVFVLFLSVQVTHAGQGKLEVFVSIPPQQWICEQLGQEYVNSHILIAKGQEPHTFEPSPRQIQALSGADLFFTAGLAFEREVTRRLRTSSPGLIIIDSSRDIQKIPIAGAGHGHGETLDPHVWLSPVNLKQMASLMAAALVEQDPDRKVFYTENLLALQRLLDDLDLRLAKELAPYQGASFFVFHPAFGYFANRYHLQQVAVETGGKAPTPKQLFALIRKAREDEVKVIFVQPQFDPRSAESVAKGIGGKVVSLDPLAADVVGNLEIMAAKIVSALREQKK